MLKEGDVAPDFTLKSQDGKDIALHEYLGSKNVVLYFYPKDFTPGCSAEAKAFGENYQKLVDAGAEVLGVSSDSPDRHKAFAADCRVSFPLLSDDGGRVRSAYGAKGTLGLVPGRVTFIIDRKGVVRSVFSSQVHPRRHVDEALKALQSIDK